jgi:hypothetical protein
MDFRVLPVGADRAGLRVRKVLGSVFGIRGVVEESSSLLWMGEGGRSRHSARPD